MYIALICILPILKFSVKVFVMAASNLPWDLDVAVLRRLEKRVIVPLPECEAREQMLRKHLGSRCVAGMPFDEIGRLTEGFSGADIESLCREAAMRPVRRLMQKLQELDGIGSSLFESSCSASSSTSQAVGPVPNPPPSVIKLPPGPSNRGGSSSGSSSVAATVKANQAAAAVDAEALLLEDPVSIEDMKSALESTRPSSHGSMKE